MDANCRPGRARPRNVVARGQVAHTLYVDAGENVCVSPCRSARSSMAGRPYAHYGPLADITARSRHVRFAPDSGHSADRLACPFCARSGHGQRTSLPGVGPLVFRDFDRHNHAQTAARSARPPDLAIPISITPALPLPNEKGGCNAQISIPEYRDIPFDHMRLGSSLSMRRLLSTPHAMPTLVRLPRL